METLDNVICLDLTKKEFNQYLDFFLKNKYEPLYNKNLSLKQIWMECSQYELWLMITKLTMHYRPFQASKDNAAHHVINTSIEQLVYLFCSARNKEDLTINYILGKEI